MTKKNIDKFIEILISGDSDKLVKFAKTLPNCPHCNEEWEIKDNNLICDGCGLTILNVDPPSPIHGQQGVW